MERNRNSLGGQPLSGDAEPILSSVYDSARHANLSGQRGFGGRTIFLSVVAAFRAVVEKEGEDILALDENAVQGRGSNVPLFMITNFNFHDAVQLKKLIQFWGDRSTIEDQPDGSHAIGILSYNPDVTHPATSALITVGPDHGLAACSLDQEKPYLIESLIGYMDRLPGLYAYRELLSEQDYQIALAVHEGRPFDRQGLQEAFVTTQVKQLIVQRVPSSLENVRMDISLKVSDEDSRAVIGQAHCRDELGDFASGEIVYRKLDWQKMRSLDVDAPRSDWNFSISDVSLS